MKQPTCYSCGKPAVWRLGKKDGKTCWGCDEHTAGSCKVNTLPVVAGEPYFVPKWPEITE